MSNTEQKNGWGQPTPTSRKYHYFDGFRSLCGRYGWLGDRSLLEDEFDDHPDNCKQCKRVRLAQTKVV